MENQTTVYPSPGAKLAEALSKAQSVFSVPKKTKTNPHFRTKYADLADVIDAVKDGLAKNDLAVIQGVDDKFLKTTLVHKSGEFIETKTPLYLDKQTMQGLGSALTYARRYALSALLNVASDEDDDGNGANEKAAHTPQPKPAAAQNGPITEAQIKRLFAISHSKGWTNEQVKLVMTAAWGLESTKDLDRETYEILVNAIETMSYPQAVQQLNKEK
jgi:hypothetical protein